MWEWTSKSGTSKWCSIWLLIRTIPSYLKDHNLWHSHAETKKNGPFILTLGLCIPLCYLSCFPPCCHLWADCDTEWLLGMYSWFVTQPWRNQERRTVQSYSRQPASSRHLSLRPVLLKIGSHPAFCWPISRHWNLARYVVMFCNTLMQKSQKMDHLFLL